MLPEPHVKKEKNIYLLQLMSISICFQGPIFTVLFILCFFQPRSSDLVFEDVDEDFDQELGQLSLGACTSTLSLFCRCCKPLVLKCQRLFFIKKDRYVLGGVF